jgi:hypothetical protein
MGTFYFLARHKDKATRLASVDSAFRNTSKTGAVWLAFNVCPSLVGKVVTVPAIGAKILV